MRCTALLKEHVERTMNGRGANRGCDGDAGHTFHRVYAGFGTAPAKPVARTRCSQRSKGCVVRNNNNRPCRERIGAEVKWTRVQNKILSLFHYDGDDEIVGRIAGIIFVKPENLTTIRGAGAVGIAAGERLRVGWRTNHHSSG